ncbi:MAG: YceI family protein [Sphingobacteriales bacterium]|uniref:YceI family protein n=1 Tax=Hydrotalea flava TaxID=714549 RepID=UPI00082C75A4|nr:YceI family protein [Hydrotalea flava]RTL48840.1 MAG: YceI family protein [Sphingobacteriales bacterium]
MKKILLLIFICQVFLTVHSQVYLTRTGFIGFYSKTPFEDIRAENNQVYAAIDTRNKDIAFVLLMKGFVFTKELMQEHFNENYAETDKFPKANFIGKFSGNADFSKDGVYPVTVNGNLTIHGISHNIQIPATLQMKAGKLTGHAQFYIKPEEFNIRIPSIVRNKIEEKMNIIVDISCTPK